MDTSRVSVPAASLKSILLDSKRMVGKTSGDYDLARFEVRSGSLGVVRYAGDARVSSVLPGDGFGSGVAFADAAKVEKILGKLRGDVVEVRVGEDFSLTDGQTSVKLDSLDPGCASSFTESFDASEHSLCVESADLQSALATVLHAAAASEYQTMLRGVLIEGSHDGRVVASDGFRFARYALPEFAGAPDSVLFAANMRGLEMSLRKASSDVRVSFGPGLPDRERTVSFSYSVHGASVVAEFESMDGRFPDYRRIEAGLNSGCSFRFDSDSLRGLADRLLAFAPKDFNYRVDVGVCLDRGVLMAKAVGELGEASESFEVLGEASVVPSAEVAFNASFLLDAAKVCSGRVEWHLDGQRPSVLRPVDSPAEFWVVPLRTE